MEKHIEKIEDFFLEIVETEEYEEITYLLFSIRMQILRFILRKREVGIGSFMKPLQDMIKRKINDSNLDVNEILYYIIDNDKNNWSFHYVLTCFRKKTGVGENQYYSAILDHKEITSYIEWDLDKFAILIIGFTADYFRKNIIDIKEIVAKEKFLYETNQYGLSKINGAIFKRDGLIYDHKYYLYNILTNTSVIGFTDGLPGFAKIISEKVHSGDILYRLDERLSVDESEEIAYTTLNFEKFYGPQFNFDDTNLKYQKTAIVHIDIDTMDKLLMIIKQREDIKTGEKFWHIEIETLPYVNETKTNTNHVITTFLHGMYYPQRDIFTHIDYTKNQYNKCDYILKYSESTESVPIDFYADRELHYKIWCIENGEYSREIWYSLMICSLAPKYQKLLNEILK